MKINLMLLKDRKYAKLKTLDLDFVPHEGCYYVDNDTKVTHYVTKTLVFSDKKVGVLLSSGSDKNFETYASMVE